MAKKTASGARPRRVPACAVCGADGRTRACSGCGERCCGGCLEGGACAACREAAAVDEELADIDVEVELDDAGDEDADECPDEDAWQDWDDEDDRAGDGED